MKLSNFEVVQWKDVEAFVTWLVSQLKAADVSPTGVYGPPRGGLTLAVMLSHALDVPFLTEPVKDCLWVDDIVDTGKALYPYKSQDVYTASMYYNANLSCCAPDFWYKEKRKGTWVEFPWEFRVPGETMSKKELEQTTKHNETYRGV